MASPTTGMSQVDQARIPDMIIISPINFGRGGSPRFAAQASNHHRGRRVVMVLNPRVTNIFRV